MVNQHKQVEQETAYSAVVVNDHMYPRPYIIFDPKVMDGDTYDHKLQLQFLVSLVFADLPSLSLSFQEHKVLFYKCFLF